MEHTRSNWGELPTLNSLSTNDYGRRWDTNLTTTGTQPSGITSPQPPPPFTQTRHPPISHFEHMHAREGFPCQNHRSKRPATRVMQGRARGFVAGLSVLQPRGSFQFTIPGPGYCSAEGKQQPPKKQGLALAAKRCRVTRLSQCRWMDRQKGNGRADPSPHPRLPVPAKRALASRRPARSLAPVPSPAGGSTHGVVPWCVERGEREEASRDWLARLERVIVARYWLGIVRLFRTHVHDKCCLVPVAEDDDGR